jgi:hypothetical protein
MVTSAPSEGPSVSCAAVVGDVVSSRQHSDQHALFSVLKRVLADVNRRETSIQPLQMTIGDEFQGAYGRLGTALEACLLVRLRLIGVCDVRFGVGWGEITVYDPDLAPMAQSGSAWWRAREAVDEVAALSSRRMWPRGVRTLVKGAESNLGAALNAFLLCRDELLADMDQSAARIALGVISGERQSDIAEALGVSQPAVSKQQRSNGVMAVLRAHDLLKRMNG